MEVLVLIDDDNDVIGVVSSKDKAVEMMKGYYGKKAKDIHLTDDVRDSGIDSHYCVVLKNERHYVTLCDYKVDSL